MKKKSLSLLPVFLAMLFLFTACSSGGNDVSRAYDKALNEMKKGNYTEAAAELESIFFYEDSVQLAQYCRAHAKAADHDYYGAVEILRDMGSYRDAEKCIWYFIALADEEKATSYCSCFIEN